jgi:hypothetical protein
MLFSSLSTALNYSQYSGELIGIIIKQLLWGAIFIISYYSSINKVDNIHQYILAVSPLLFYLVIEYYLTRQYALIQSAAESSIYYVLLLLPFVLDIKRREIKIVLIILISFCVLISLKRTALIAFFLSLACYFLINLVKSNYKKRSQ